MVLIHSFRHLLQRILAGASGSSHKARTGKPRCRLYLEELEPRLDPAGTVSIADASVLEPAPHGTVILDFTVTRTGDLSAPLGVNYTTVAGTAQPNTDFTPTTGTVTFASGSATALIAVPIFGNGVFNNPNLTFAVQLTGIAGVASGSASFANNVDFAAARGALSVAVGDLNGDGKPDLVVADDYSNSLTVLLNTTPTGATTPSFAPGQTLPAGQRPISVALGDFNGDGRPDIVVANQSDATVSVLLNETPTGAASATFSGPQYFATNYLPESVAVGDINGDGRPDIVIADNNNDGVNGTTVEFDYAVASVLLNTTPTGAAIASFAPRQDFAAGVDLGEGVALGDFNGDGRPDIAITNNEVESGMPTQFPVLVLLNETAPGAGVAAFAPPETFLAGMSPIAVAVSDINGDGRPDLVVLNTSYYGNTRQLVSVLLNVTPPGAATAFFAPQQILAVSYDPIAVALADVNGDGKPDLLVANSGNSSVSVLLNLTPTGAATASFTPRQNFATSDSGYYNATDVAIGDINGDGQPDLLVVKHSPNYGAVSVLLNTSSPTIVRGTATGTILESDVGFVSADSASFVPGHFGTFTVTAAGNPAPALTRSGGALPSGVTFTDNGNGTATLAGTPPVGSNGAFTFTLTAANGLEPPVAQAFTLYVGPVESIVGRVQQSGQWWVGVSNGSSFSNTLWDAWASAVAWLDVQTGDFNGAGQADIVGRDAATGGWWVGLSNGSSGFTTTLWDAWSPGIPWTDVRVADFNGDGKDDLAGFDPIRGGWWVSLSTGRAFAPAVLWTQWSPGLTWVDVQAGDLNGDGKADLIGRARESGQWWANVSTGAAFQTELWGAWAADNPGVLDWVDVRLGDVNGDGRADVVGRVQESGQWWVSLSGTNGFTSTRLWDAWSPGYTWVDVQLADFNGDGKLDLVGRALQTGQWWVGLSTGSGFAPRLWDVWSAGVTWVDVQVGDFNGDGKADIAGRDVLDGSWWVGVSNGSAFATSAWDTWATAITWVDVHAAKFT